MSYKSLARNALPWQVINAVNRLINGKMNIRGTVTLPTDASTTTVVDDPRVGPESIILLMPTTAAAATEYVTGSVYISSRDTANKQFTITHSNSGVAARTFDYGILG